jgi:hypothetical protein
MQIITGYRQDLSIQKASGPIKCCRLPYRLKTNTNHDIDEKKKLAVAGITSKLFMISIVSNLTFNGLNNFDQ